MLRRRLFAPNPILLRNRHQFGTPTVAPAGAAKTTATPPPSPQEQPAQQASTTATPPSSASSFDFNKIQDVIGKNAGVFASVAALHGGQNSAWISRGLRAMGQQHKANSAEKSTGNNTELDNQLERERKARKAAEEELKRERENKRVVTKKKKNSSAPLVFFIIIIIIVYVVVTELNDERKPRRSTKS